MELQCFKFTQNCAGRFVSMSKQTTACSILHALLVVVLTLYTVPASGQLPSRPLPNIIYIYADDMGYGEPGCYGQQKIKTPHLDHMAKEGIRFTHHYAGAPVCAPSRAMLMTGKHAGHAYIRGNYELGGFRDDEEGGQMPLPEGVYTVPRLLKQAGYITGMSGKWGLGMKGTSGEPSLQGFDYYYSVLDQKQAHNFYPTHMWENGKWDTLGNPVITVHRPIDSTKVTDADFDYFKGNRYSIDKITEKALGFINENSDKRFFLYLPYTLPHVSLQVPDKALQQYIGQFDEKPYYGQRGYASHKTPLSAYAAMVSYLDSQVGVIMKKIKDIGLDSNTLIMFSSDNGPSIEGGADPAYFNASGGLRGVKRDLYEGGIRVPFIARWPAIIKPNTVSDHISTQYDLLATLAELCQATIPGGTDGISFLKILLGQPGSQHKHEYLYFEFPEKGGQVAIRHGNWKGIRINVKKDRNAAWQLYDLLADPRETNDLAAGQPAIIRLFEMIQLTAHQHSHIREWEFIDPKFEDN